MKSSCPSGSQAATASSKRDEAVGVHEDNLDEPFRMLAWPPLQSLAVKKNLFFVQSLGGEKLLKFVEGAGEIFLSGLRGANIFFGRVSDRFSDLFRVFQTVFRIDLKVFRGQFRSADMPP